jgi:acetate kinase
VNILVLNAGSSSLKFRLFRIDALRPLSEREDVLSEGQVERIGKADAGITVRDASDTEPRHRAVGAESVSEAAHEILRHITTPLSGRPAITIDAVGHRIVHGGARFFQPALIDDAVLSDIRELTELAPLHNPAGVAGIEAVRQTVPNAPNVAVFDTAFHHNLPAVAARYALPAELSDRLQLRRYGFHGISYRYVSERLLLCLGESGRAARLILCHLGNGASVCALRDGQSVDTSMGFTPLEGLIMGNRSGDVDPGMVLHLLRAGHMTLEQMDGLLNRQSGLLGLSGSSSDVRDLEKAAGGGDSAAELALACFAYRVRKYIGAYAAVLGGVDAVVFTGGIGEHSALMRARICHGLEFLSLNLDDERNEAAGGQELASIGAGDGSRVWIVQTDEERQIARETLTVLHA